MHRWGSYTIGITSPFPNPFCMETFTTKDGTTITYDGKNVAIKKQSENPLLWNPEEGDSYVLLLTDGVWSNNQWANGINENERFDRGNVFRTREEAQSEDRKRLAQMKIKRWIAEKNEGWEPDWNNRDSEKYFVYWQYCEGLRIDCHWVKKFVENVYYMKSSKIAEQLLKELPEECELVFGAEA